MDKVLLVKGLGIILAVAAFAVLFLFISGRVSAMTYWLDTGLLALIAFFGLPRMRAYAQQHRQ